MAELHREIDAQMELGECPLWDHRHNRLYWVDILHMKLYQLDWTTGEHRQWGLPSLGGGLGLLGDDALIVATQTGLFRFYPDTGRYEFVLNPSPGTPTHRLNEGKTDFEGNFWIGSISTLGRLPECALFRVTPSGAVTTMLEGISVPNALVFDGDRRQVTFADSAQRLIWTFSQDDNGKLAERKILVDDRTLESIPDGAVRDSDGRLWNAKFGGARVVAYDREGLVAGAIVLPVSQVTSCAFCGPDLNYLAVTTAKRLLTDKQRQEQPRAGNLFIYSMDETGLPEPVCPSMTAAQ
ncbi:conserved hypothetical protein [Agrobacterium tumefaciens str. Kerr 14]|uniref:SMP-30/Gluconolactonase/LRE-like region domain-containing protein n=1 Tax=Agrobacterium tumefaciens str. Kerr 14 TaxID=1183424 RepID=A0A1S7SA30_AGRTU|nr:SMP-30/gluconolactonase/LRE family protein [Agrobacterium tumefaciens]CUX65312.1 conserved hypothetical protein [Agrobacterium tumefaciens str. Kerr 14]